MVSHHRQIFVLTPRLPRAAPQLCNVPRTPQYTQRSHRPSTASRKPSTQSLETSMLIDADAPPWIGFPKSTRQIPRGCGADNVHEGIQESSLVTSQVFSAAAGKGLCMWNGAGSCAKHQRLLLYSPLFPFPLRHAVLGLSLLGIFASREGGTLLHSAQLQGSLSVHRCGSGRYMSFTSSPSQQDNGCTRFAEMS